MDFLKKLFGGGSGGGSGGSDTTGFFVYVQCDRCQEQLRLRIIKQHDLNYSADGFVWRKTIVDSRCFQQIPVVAHFDRNLNLIGHEIAGGHFITREEYERSVVSDTTDAGELNE
jgi:hypothetical protein